MEFTRSGNNEMYGVGECQLFEPFSREYVVKETIKGKVCRILLPCASVYGWVLFKVFDLEQARTFLCLYSLFTTEVIRLPDLGELNKYRVATFSLSATSPKCVVFLLRMDRLRHKIYVKLYFVGDYSWKNFEFNNDGLDWSNNRPVNVVYANEVFYCVFARGQLGAFNVELEQWTILVDHPLMPKKISHHVNLIASNGDLRLLVERDVLQLFKFDFSEMLWVYENSLNNHVLFIGCTSFYAPAVGETSQLANTIFFGYRSVRCYGSTSPSRSESLLYRKCVAGAKCAMTWIELPLGGIWSANDLITAV